MLELIDVTKQYDDTLLFHTNMKFEDRGLYFITGISGCGKSTLLNIIGGLDDQYGGVITYNGKDIKKEKNYIKKHIGFMFQKDLLNEQMSVKSNILLPGYFKHYLKNWKEYLPKFQINYLKKKTAILSRGQKQRINLLKTMITSNDIILCDEPTGSLDSYNARIVYEELKKISREKLVIVVSHDEHCAKEYGDYIYELKNQKLECIYRKNTPKQYIQEKKYKRKTFIQLMLLYFKTYFKKHILLMQCLMLCILCLMMTLSLTFAGQNEIKAQIEAMIPSSLIVLKKRNNQEISLEELHNLKHQSIQYRFLDNSQIEVLGLSNLKTYQEDKTYFINDYSQTSFRKLSKGRMPENDQEIALPQNTYDNLCYSLNSKNLLNKNIQLYVMYEDEIKAMKLKIVGIVDFNSPSDAIYFKEDSYINNCIKLFPITGGKVAYMMLDDINQLKNIKNKYPNYQFQKANGSIMKAVNNNLKNMGYILYIFSSLSLVSILLVVFVVFYLDVIKKRKFFALLKTMGASRIQIIMLVLFQGIGIYLIAFLESFMISSSIVEFINIIIEELLMIENMLSINTEILIISNILTLCLIFISMIIPSYIASYTNVIKTLQKS